MRQIRRAKVYIGVNKVGKAKKLGNTSTYFSYDLYG